jgi:hypothetical protein
MESKCLICKCFTCKLKLNGMCEYCCVICIDNEFPIDNCERYREYVENESGEK